MSHVAGPLPSLSPITTTPLPPAPPPRPPAWRHAASLLGLLCLWLLTGPGVAPAQTSVPAAPTGLTGKQTGPGRVMLRWTDPADTSITKYQYCRKTFPVPCAATPAGDWTDISGSGATTTTHPVPRLSTGVYIFAVRAVNAGGLGRASDAVHITVVPVLRAAPGVGRVALSWTAPSWTVTRYDYRYKAGTGNYGKWTPTESMTLAYLVKDLDNDTAYTFQVRAVNSAGDKTVLDTASATPTTLQLYWSDSGTRKIQQAKLAGTLTDIRNSVRDVISSGLTTPMGLAVDAAAGWLYWADRGTNKLQRANLDGTGVQDLVSTGPSWPTSLALDVAADKLYWTEQFTGKIRQAALDGSNSTIRDWVTSGLERPYGLAPDLVAGHLYWTDWGRDKVQRANLAGSTSTIRDLVTRGLRRPYGLALNGGAGLLSWVDWEAHKIQRARLDGSNKRDLVTAAEGVNSPKGIALDVAGNKLYWTDAYAIKRATLDGSGPEALVSTGLSNPQGVALLLPPGPIRDLTATPGKESGQVTLGWTRPADGGTITSYQYCQQTGTEACASANIWTDMKGSGATTTSYVVPGLTNDTKYTFQVRAVNLAGDGPASNKATATPREPPGKPTGLTATAGDRQVTLSWTAASGTVTEYEYCGKTVPATCDADTAGDWTDTDSTSTTHTVRELTNGTKYTFQVRAVNVDVPGPPSNEDTETLPPGKPTNLTAEAGDGQVTLRWTAPSGKVTSYDFRYKKGNEPYGNWTPTGRKDTTHVVPGLSNGKTYTFQVRAVNVGGSGEVATTGPIPVVGPPGQIRDLRATPGNESGQVTLNWTAPANATSYQSCRKIGTGACTWTSIPGSGPPPPPPPLTVTVTGLLNGTTYTLRMRAVNIAGPGPPSNPITLGPPPGAPTDLTATPGDAQVTLNWTAPTTGTVTGYAYRYKAGSGNYGNWTSTGNTTTTHTVTRLRPLSRIVVPPPPGNTTTTKVVTELTNGTTYTFQVRAVNGAVPGPASNEATATPRTPPGAPTGLKAKAGDRQVTLSWTAPTTGTVTSYDFHYKEGNGNYGKWKPIPDSGATTTSYVVPDLTNGTTYTFQVRAKNGDVPGPPSNEATVTLPPGKPTPLSAAPGPQRVALAWTAPSGTVTGYDYRYKAGSGNYGEWTSTDSKTTTHLVTDLTNGNKLTNGTKYTFQVRAKSGDVTGPESVEAAATPTATVRQLYWTSWQGGKIQRANLDGTGVESLVPRGYALALDAAAGKLYWSNSPKIQRANLDGTGVEDIVTDVAPSDYLALDRDKGKLYWVTWSGNIQWANLDGTDRKDFVTGLRNPRGLALDVAAGKLYWSSETAGGAGKMIQRANLDGTDVEDLFVTGRQNLWSLALNEAAGNKRAKLYWASAGIKRAKLDGTDIEYLGVGSAYALALDVAAVPAGKLYAAHHDTQGPDKIRRADLDGTDVEDLVAGLNDPDDLTLLLKPGVLRTLSAIPGAGQVTLAWPPPVAGGTVARWEYSKDNGTNWTVMAGSTAGTTSHVVTGLTNGTAYTFKVRAVNLVGDGPASPAASATPAVASAAPGAPTRLTATGGNGQVTLTWTAPTGPITKYQYQQKAGSGNYSDWTDISRLAPTHTVTKLTDGTAYTFRVRAVNGSGDGTASSAVTATTLPAKPTGLTATTGTGQVTLAWTDPTDTSITKYQYRQRTGTGNYGNWTDIPSSGATTTSYVVTGLSNTTAYFFRLRAVNAGGPSPASDDEVPAKPAKPTGLTATAGNGQVTLAWTNPTDASITKYQYQQKAGSGNYSDWTDIPSSGATTTTYVVPGLTNGTAYSFKLLAVNRAGNGPASSEVSATPTAPASTSQARAVNDTGGDAADEAAPPPLGILEQPAPHTVQSGLGLLSGWVCEAETVSLVLTTESGTVHRAIAAYGTSRTDTQEACGDRNNGFSLVWNWNLLGDGTHQVQVLADGEEVVSRAVTVVTPGRALVRGVSGPYRVADFPRVGESVDLHWDEALQHFRLAPAEAGGESVGLVVSGHPASLLENPAPHSVQSGLGLISGWVCEAESVAVRLTTASGVVHQLPVAYGMSRADTADKCGDTENGFGAVFNWNQLGAGTHTVALLVDGVEDGRQSFRVTTWGEEFVRGLHGPARVEDFPEPGQAVIVEWQAGWQHFGIVGVEEELGITN